MIHSIFRSLREKWESFSDTLSDTQRKLEVCLLQWSSYDDSFDQFRQWINQAKAKFDKELKATLQDKKVQLQSHKVGLKIASKWIAYIKHGLQTMSAKL